VINRRFSYYLHSVGFLVDGRQTGSNPFHPSRGLPATNLSLFPRRLQFPIPLGLNFLLMPGEHVLRRDVSDGAVQAHIVVTLHVTLNQTPRIFERQRRSRADALPFEAIVALASDGLRYALFTAGVDAALKEAAGGEQFGVEHGSAGGAAHQIVRKQS